MKTIKLEKVNKWNVMIKENSESRKLVKEMSDLIFDNLRDAEFEYKDKQFLAWSSYIPEVDEVVPSNSPFFICFLLDATGRFSNDDGFYIDDVNMIGINLEVYFLSHLGYTVDEMNKALTKIVKKDLPVDFQKKVLNKMYSIFVHEVSHFLDTKVKNIPVAEFPDNDYNKFRDIYHNHPNEVNAVLNAAILKVQRNPDWKKLPFDKFSRKVMDEINPMVKKHLSQDNKKRMMKVIYSAYH